MSLFVTRHAWRIFFLLLLATVARAQAPAWQNALTVATPVAGGVASVVSATAVDSAGNVFLTGSFSGTVTLGATTLSSPSGDDVFVAKWHPATGFVWVVQVGGPDNDEGYALAIRGHSVYVAGSFFSPTMRVGTTTLTNADVSGQPGSPDVFVAKLTDLGTTATWTWAQRAGGVGMGASSDNANTLAVSGNDVYVAGNYNSPTAHFGTTTITNPSVAIYDGFVAKLTDAGPTASWTWAQSFGGAEYEQVYALAVSGGSVYVGGFFESPTMAFGATTLHLTGFFLNGFVAKLADAGASAGWAWAENVGGAANAIVCALTADGGNVYVAGSFHDSCAFAATTLTSKGSTDGFVAKLTDAGTTTAWTWAERVGGVEGDAVRALAVSGRRLYVSGQFRARADFGADTLTSAGQYDAFVGRLTDAGATAGWDWTQGGGGARGDEAYALAVGGGTVYAAGNFNSTTATFGSFALTCAAGIYSSGFLLALRDPILGDPAEVAAGALSLYPNPAHQAARLTGARPAAALRLLDGRGRVVLTTTTDAAGSATLDVRGLPAGLYLLQTAGAAAQRLVIE